MIPDNVREAIERNKSLIDDLRNAAEGDDPALIDTLIDELDNNMRQVVDWVEQQPASSEQTSEQTSEQASEQSSEQSSEQPPPAGRVVPQSDLPTVPPPAEPEKPGD